MPRLPALLALILAVFGLSRRAEAQSQPIPIKVVVVAMFELGADTGDRPGEFQHWVEGKKLDRVLPFPQGYRDLRMNDSGVLGVVTGVGTARAAATIMALGLDPRFDLSKAYWVVAGIAGIDPEEASLGSAAWAEWIVDGDLGHEIDAREIPAGWKTGMVPLRKSIPYEQPKETGDTAEVFRLDPGLVEWAYQLTKDVTLDRVGADEGRARALPRRDRAAAPVRAQGRHAVGRHLLDWREADRVGERLGRVPHRQGRYVTSRWRTRAPAVVDWLSRAGRVDVRRVRAPRRQRSRSAAAAAPPPTSSRARRSGSTPLPAGPRRGLPRRQRRRRSARGRLGDARDTPPSASPRQCRRDRIVVRRRRSSAADARTDEQS